MIEAACERHKADLIGHPQLDDVLAVDQWARQAVREQVNGKRSRTGTRRMRTAFFWSRGRDTNLSNTDSTVDQNTTTCCFAPQPDQGQML